VLDRCLRGLYVWASSVQIQGRWSPVTYNASPLCLESHLLPYDRRWRRDVTCHGHISVDELSLSISGGLSCLMKWVILGAVSLLRSPESSFIISFGGTVILCCLIEWFMIVLQPCFIYKWYVERGCTNPIRRVAWATKFCVVAPNICGPLVCSFHHVTIQTSRILIWRLAFWKICEQLKCR